MKIKSARPAKPNYREMYFKELERHGYFESVLRLIATPIRSDGTWNRDREACRQLAEEALNHD